MANSSILLDNEEKTEIPAAVRLAQQQGFLSMESNQLCQWQNCSFRLIL